MISKVADSIFYIGANDHDVDLFEGQYVVPNGMCYNSYLVADSKTAVFDTIAEGKTSEWLANIEEVMNQISGPAKAPQISSPANDVAPKRSGSPSHSAQVAAISA